MPLGPAPQRGQAGALRGLLPWKDVRGVCRTGLHVEETTGGTVLPVVPLFPYVDEPSILQEGKVSRGDGRRPSPSPCSLVTFCHLAI